MSWFYWYSSGSLHWHCGVHMMAPVPMKQHWITWAYFITLYNHRWQVEGCYARGSDLWPVVIVSTGGRWKAAMPEAVTCGRLLLWAQVAGGRLLCQRLWPVAGCYCEHRWQVEGCYARGCDLWPVVIMSRWSQIGLVIGVPVIWTTHQVSEWLSLTAFWGTADIGVHVVHTSGVIIAYTLESLSSLT